MEGNEIIGRRPRDLVPVAAYEGTHRQKVHRASPMGGDFEIIFMCTSCNGRVNYPDIFCRWCGRKFIVEEGV
jgi:hypothetical protein